MKPMRTLFATLLALALCPAAALCSQEFRAPVNNSTMSAPGNAPQNQPAAQGNAPSALDRAAAMPGVPAHIIEQERAAQPAPKPAQPDLANAPERFDFAYNKVRLLAPFADETAMLEAFFWDRGEQTVKKRGLMGLAVRLLCKQLSNLGLEPYTTLVNGLDRHDHQALAENEALDDTYRFRFIEPDGTKDIIYDRTRNRIIAWTMKLDKRHLPDIAAKLARNHGQPKRLAYDLKGLGVKSGELLLWQSRASVAVIDMVEGRLFMVNSHELDRAITTISEQIGRKMGNSRQQLRQNLQ